MRIFINGEGAEVVAGTAIVDIIEVVTKTRDPAGVAVALNGRVVSRSQWTTTPVVDDDRVEVLRATAGG